MRSFLIETKNQLVKIKKKKKSIYNQVDNFLL